MPKSEGERLVGEIVTWTIPEVNREIGWKETVYTPMCRMCDQRKKMIFHILSECSKLAQSDYGKRHDRVEQNVHWNT